MKLKILSCKPLWSVTLLRLAHSSDSLRYFVLYKYQPPLYCQKDISRILLQLEAKWIHHLNTMSPYGLNSCLDSSVFV